MDAPMPMAETPIFTTGVVDAFTPPGSPRTYLIQPLSYTQRAAFRAEHARRGGIFPSNAQMFAALRVAVEANSPANADDLLSDIALAEAEPENAQAKAKLTAIEAACAALGGYAELLAARRLWTDMLPFVAARHALRGWEGPGLPEFQKDAAGLVPPHLLEVLPDAELADIGWRADALMQPSRAAVGNSSRLSSSPGSPEPAKGETRRKTAARGSSEKRHGR